MGMGGGQQSLVGLAGNEAVQQDLGVKEDQVNKLADLADDEREARMAAGRDSGFDFRAVMELPEAERQAKMEEFTKKMQELGKKVDAQFEPKLAEVLDDAQLDRLRQISWQASGVQAYQDPEVVAALAITQEQQDKIAAAIKDHQAKRSELFRGMGPGRGPGGGGPGRGPGGPGGPGGGGDFQERFAKMRELDEARDTAVKGLLTSEQQAQFKEMLGAEFDVAQLRPRFGGRGGPGGPGGGPGGPPGPGGRPQGRDE
jgi:hypothetical protein